MTKENFTAPRRRAFDGYGISAKETSRRIGSRLGLGRVAVYPVTRPRTKWVRLWDTDAFDRMMRRLSSIHLTRRFGVARHSDLLTCPEALFSGRAVRRVIPDDAWVVRGIPGRDRSPILPRRPDRRTGSPFPYERVRVDDFRLDLRRLIGCGVRSRAI